MEEGLRGGGENTSENQKCFTKRAYVHNQLSTTYASNETPTCSLKGFLLKNRAWHHLRFLLLKASRYAHQAAYSTFKVSRWNRINKTKNKKEQKKLGRKVLFTK